MEALASRLLAFLTLGFHAWWHTRPRALLVAAAILEAPTVSYDFARSLRVALREYAPDVGLEGAKFYNGSLSDLYMQMIPWQSTVREAFSRGELPLWNPYMLAGTVLAALYDPETAQLTFSLAGHLPPLIVPRGETQGDVPLSFAQERLWFLVQMNPESPAYNMLHTLWLHGRLDAWALRRSLDALVRRLIDAASARIKVAERERRDRCRAVCRAFLRAGAGDRVAVLLRVRRGDGDRAGRLDGQVGGAEGDRRAVRQIALSVTSVSRKARSCGLFFCPAHKKSPLRKSRCGPYQAVY